MKKLLALLFVLLPLSLVYVSCSDDDDLPDVSVSITTPNAMLGDTIYVVQGDSLIVSSINIRNNEADKNALITGAEFFFTGEGYYTPIIPFTWRRPTSADPQNFNYIPTGKYPFNIEVTIAAEGKALAIGVLPYIVRIVADAAEIPEDALPGQTGFVRLNVDKK